MRSQACLRGTYMFMSEASKNYRPHSASVLILMQASHCFKDSDWSSGTNAS